MIAINQFTLNEFTENYGYIVDMMTTSPFKYNEFMGDSLEIHGIEEEVLRLINTSIVTLRNCILNLTAAKIELDMEALTLHKCQVTLDVNSKTLNKIQTIALCEAEIQDLDNHCPNLKKLLLNEPSTSFIKLMT